MDVIIYGGGLLGRQIHYLINTYYSEKMNVIGFVDDVLPKNTAIAGGLINLGSLEEMSADPKYAPGQVNMVLAIGYTNMKGRRNAYLRAKKMGYQCESIIHPEAVIEKNVELGEGVTVLAGVVLDQFVKVKEINYLDIGTLIGENTEIGPNNYFSAGCTVGGSVKIGEDNFFGLNVTMVNDIIIGCNNFVNAKTLIYRNLGDNYQVVEVHQSRLVGRKES